MVRRDLALVVVLAAAVAGGAIGVVLLVGSGRTGLLPEAARAADRDRGPARDASPPEPPGVEHVAAPLDERADDSNPAGEPPGGTTGARREPEGSEEVRFSGLIRVGANPEKLGPLDGTIVLKNADPAAPPLHLEIPVRNGSFCGRGPGNAVVTVERLLLAGREATRFEESFALASGWLEVDATFASPMLLHVVDASSGIELTGVTLRGPVHFESAALDPLGGGSTQGGPFRLLRSRRSSRTPSGFDSPLELARCDSKPTPGPIYLGSDDERLLIAHVKGYGDDGCDVVEGGRSFTLSLRPAAPLRVTVAPWPPPGIDAAARRIRLVVTLARLFERPMAPEAGTSNPARSPMPTEASAHVEALGREVLARLDRRRVAAASPQRHITPADEQGVATFDDLCEGTWLAWASSRSDGDERSVVVNGQHLVGADGRPPVDLVECRLVAGRGSEVTLPSVEPDPVKATLAVRVVDATTGAPIELRLEEIAVYDLDDPEMSTRPRFVGGLLGRRPKGVTVAASARANPADADSFDVHSGIAVVKILPRNHVEYEPVTRWVEVAAGANEIVVPLIRSAAVVVEVASAPAFSAKGERTFSSRSTEGTAIPIVRRPGRRRLHGARPERRIGARPLPPALPLRTSRPRPLHADRSEGGGLRAPRRIRSRSRRARGHEDRAPRRREGPAAARRRPLTPREHAPARTPVLDHSPACAVSFFLSTLFRYPYAT